MLQTPPTGTGVVSAASLEIYIFYAHVDTTKFVLFLFNERVSDERSKILIVHTITGISYVSASYFVDRFIFSPHAAEETDRYR